MGTSSYRNSPSSLIIPWVIHPTSVRNLSQRNSSGNTGNDSRPYTTGADLYIPFIEQSLRALVPGGTLGFICADRWMKNKYGQPLRQFIADGFNLRYYVDMNDTEPFLSAVTAYPAVTIINREDAGPTRMAYRPRIETGELNRLAKALRGPAGEVE